MDALKRLIKAGFAKRQAAALLADCTAEETAAIASAASGAQLRKVLDAIADRQGEPTEIDQPDQVIAKGEILSSQFDVSLGDGTLEKGWTDEEEREYGAEPPKGDGDE